jgi:hypothetical protein
MYKEEREELVSLIKRVISEETPVNVVIGNADQMKMSTYMKEWMDNNKAAHQNYSQYYQFGSGYDPLTIQVFLQNDYLKIVFTAANGTRLQEFIFHV